MFMTLFHSLCLLQSVRDCKLPLNSAITNLKNIFFGVACPIWLTLFFSLIFLPSSGPSSFKVKPGFKPQANWLSTNWRKFVGVLHPMLCWKVVVKLGRLPWLPRTTLWRQSVTNFDFIWKWIRPLNPPLNRITMSENNNQMITLTDGFWVLVTGCNETRNIRLQ